jgi:hypothetical protein
MEEMKDFKSLKKYKRAVGLSVNDCYINCYIYDARPAFGVKIMRLLGKKGVIIHQFKGKKR